MKEIIEVLRAIPNSTVDVYNSDETIICLIELDENIQLGINIQVFDSGPRMSMSVVGKGKYPFISQLILMAQQVHSADQVKSLIIDSYPYRSLT